MLYTGILGGRHAVKRVATYLLLFSLFAANGCYFAKQGCDFLRMNSRAESIDRALERGDLPEDLRGALTLVGEIREFAFSIGLEKNDNYTTYVETDEDHLVDVVSACAADRFEPYQWKFPLVGLMPYKGFFEPEDAKKTASKLSGEGYDVLVSEVDAFSTLGYFRDPVYTFMKDYSPYELAYLIIHEQTHATIFVKNQARFNEELATFVGEEGALEFVRRRSVRDPEAFRDALLYLSDLDAFLSLVRGLHRELDALYASGGSREGVLEGKTLAIARFRERFEREYESNFSTEAFRAVGKMDINNAYLQVVMTYTGDLSLFRELHARLGGDLRRTVDFLKGLEKTGGMRSRAGERNGGAPAGGGLKGEDPKDAIRRFLSSSPYRFMHFGRLTCRSYRMSPSGSVHFSTMVQAA